MLLRMPKDEADLYEKHLETIQDAFTERFCGEGVPDWLLPQLTCKDFPSGTGR